METRFNVYNVESIEASNLLQIVNHEGGVTLLVGSAISMWFPTLVTPGQAVTDYLADFLASQFNILNPTEKKSIIEAITATPFEYIWDQSPHNSLLEKVFVDEYKNRLPNPVHEAIGRLVDKGIIRHVITTNYDTCLDQVFQGLANIKEVVTEEETEEINDDHCIYFKIHGSAKAGLESTIIYRLSHEGVLPDWKRQVLRRCISNSNLLVVGYSGLDFEICPEIKLAQASRVIWNSYLNPQTESKALSANALRVLQVSDQNTVMYGDMRKLFYHFGEVLPDMLVKRNAPNWKLDTILEQPEIQIWACSIISPPGYGLQAENLARKALSSIDEGSSHWASAIYLLGDALFHQGKYLQSADNCSKAAQIYWNNNDLAGYIGAIGRQADALRCGGYFWDALMVLNEAMSNIVNVKISLRERKKITNVLNLKELLVYRDFYEIAKWLKNSKLKRYYQNYSKILIQKITKVAEKEGQWNIFQQSKMWANRLDIDFSKIYKGTMQPLDDWFGFRHLGAIIPQMMAARDGLWRGTTGKKVTLEEIKDLIQQAESIGCFPEIWKLSLAYNEAFASTSGEEKLNWEKALNECEYTDFLKKFKLANPTSR